MGTSPLRRRRQLLVGVVLGALWFLLWRLAELVGVHDNVSLWFPPAGLTFALALILHRRHWPVLALAVGVGCLLGRDWATVVAEPATQAVLVVVQALAHAVPYVVAARLLRRLTSAPGGASGQPALATLLTWPPAAAVAAALGVAVVAAHGDVTASDAPKLFLTWFTGDLVGLATTAPFFALTLAAPLRAALAGGVTTAAGTPSPRLPALHVPALVALAALAGAALARSPDIVGVPGTVALASYGPMLAMLIIARTASEFETHAALVGLTLATILLAPALGMAPARGEPQLVLLTLAAIAQLGVSLRGLAAASTADPLTGVANRRGWLAATHRQLKRHGGGAVILLDLDHFKTINDTFGHAVGDEVLRRVAAQLRRGAGADAVFGRVGGEEFAVFVAGNERDASRRAARMRRALHALAPLEDGPSERIRASFGVATVPGPRGLGRAMRAADEALYRAKAAGRDRIEHAGVDVAM